MRHVRIRAAAKIFSNNKSGGVVGDEIKEIIIDKGVDALIPGTNPFVSNLAKAIEGSKTKKC